MLAAYARSCGAIRLCGEIRAAPAVTCCIKSRNSSAFSGRINIFLINAPSSSDDRMGHQFLNILSAPLGKRILEKCCLIRDRIGMGADASFHIFFNKIKSICTILRHNYSFHSMRPAIFQALQHDSSASQNQPYSTGNSTNEASMSVRKDQNIRQFSTSKSRRVTKCSHSSSKRKDAPSLLRIFGSPHSPKEHHRITSPSSAQDLRDCLLQ